jgi:hypothetical protein
MKFTTATRLDSRQVYAKALVALAIGALIGVLAAMPYDRLFGLSVEACFVLRSVVAVGLLARLGAIRESAAPSTHARSLHAAFLGSLERMRSVFRTTRGTGSTEARLIPNRA